MSTTMRVEGINQNQIDELAEFIAGLINVAEHRVAAYLGESAQEIAEFFRVELVEIPAEVAFVVLRENDRIVGALGIEGFLAKGQLYLLGPFVCHTNWNAIAWQLWETILPRVPDSAKQLRVGCDDENVRCRAFFESLHFEPQTSETTLELCRDRFAINSESPAGVRVERYADEHRESFQNMHPSSVYYTADEVLKRLNDTRVLFVALRERELIGYAYLESKPEFALAELCFIRVIEAERRRGVALTLMHTALGWAFESPQLQSVKLSVRTTNTESLALMRKLGFQSVRTITSYRRDWLQH